MLIWSIFFIIALIFICILVFYLSVELNETDKKVNELCKDIEKYYEN